VARVNDLEFEIANLRDDRDAASESGHAKFEKAPSQ
jgi:hypothetical protein